MRAVPLCLSLLLVWPALAQPPGVVATPSKVEAPVQDTIDLSSPRQALRSFVAAFNRYDFVQASRCVVGAPAGDNALLKAIGDSLKQQKMQLSVNEPRVQMRDATATAVFQLQMAQSDQKQVAVPAQPERLRMQRVDGLWKIEPGDPILPGAPGGMPGTVARLPDAPPGAEMSSGLLAMFAAFVAHPEKLMVGQKETGPANCQSNLKQLALAAYQLVQDFNGKFDFAGALLKNADKLSPVLRNTLRLPWQQATFVYAKDLDMFVCLTHHEETAKERPIDEVERARLKHDEQDLGVRNLFQHEAYESYAFNTHLDGAVLKDIKLLQRTVLLYEGQEEKPDFRHNGKTNVAFADGHVESLDINGIQKLIWDPAKVAQADLDRAECANHLKHLALATKMMEQDYKGVYDIGKAEIAPKTRAKTPFSPQLDDGWQRALWPYAEVPAIYVCSLEGKTYSFNYFLDELKDENVPNSAATVMLYEGANGKLDFRHDGCANVAFADGHVKGVTPEEAKDLIWNPKGK